MKKLGLLIVSIAAMLMLPVGIALANTATQGGDTPSEGWDKVKSRPQDGGIIVRETWKIRQEQYDDYATDLHFKVWQKEDNIDVRGWHIEISDFTNSNSQRGNQPSPWHERVDNMPGLPKTNDPDNGQHAVDVTADGANIPHRKRITVEVKFWLTSWNTKRIYGVTWTKEADEKKAIPSSGWTLDDPVPDPLNPGQYLHEFVITNDDTTDYLNVSGLTFNASMDWYDNLTNVSFPSPYSNISLYPKSILQVGRSKYGNGMPRSLERGGEAGA